ncbi:MAG: bifunctional glutamate N-acetyltransferase/amino-acid acetyltransferase ArgJ [Candidatus Omnitrophica bacterium]|nr:bifunctional glutamate N-acetyltransferase/amino-acid acetyltransferase ArgJ [Candidatus Omnitrophota bacterium]
MKVFIKALLPKKFKANGIACGLKKSGKLDLALFYSEIPAKASCKFTTNTVQAAPLKISKQHLAKGKVFQAVIANSGNANCLTGAAGLKDAMDTTKAVSKALGIKKERVLINSTGVIGKRLQISKIIDGIPQLVSGLSIEGMDKAKKAIMTTDLFAKEISVKLTLGGKVVTVCGVAKGAGMIAPNMATMFAFIFTDANISQGALDKALNLCVSVSFNCITVDGCMSTNDSVMILANGSSENKLISGGKDLVGFTNALNIVCLELAKMIVRDGEGATKFIQITVNKAKSVPQAKIAALAIANSNLFKTAVYGEDPNFGRIAAAVGASGVDMKEDSFRIKVSPLNKKDITVEVFLNTGSGRATVYTSDLTPEYIKINAEYN